MHFDQPWILFLLIPALALLPLLYGLARRRRRTLLHRFAGSAMLERLSESALPGRQHLKFVFILLAVLLMIFALARPQYGTVERPMRRRGVEVVIAIDCSTSMLSQDMEPNRFERAKEQLQGLIRRLDGDNVAVVAFAGIPITQCPMTADYGMALNLLSSLQLDTVPVQGTEIGKAIKKSLGIFQTANRGNRVLVLLTDGENHGPDAMEAAREAAEKGVRIYAIGIGSPQGAPIPLPEGGFKESDGVKVNSRLDFETLKQLALTTGGKAILANADGDMELRAINRDIQALKDSELQDSNWIIYKERFQVFLLPALLLLVGEMLLRDSRKKKANSSTAAGGTS